MNKVILMGRLTADPELKTTQSGISVVSARVAVNRRFAKQGDPVTADFIDVVFWRQTAEFVAKYFSKGRQIAIVGTLQTRQWQDKDGNKRVSVEVVSDEVYFADSKAGGEKAQELPKYEVPQGEYEEVDDDDDLPF